MNNNTIWETDLLFIIIYENYFYVQNDQQYKLYITKTECRKIYDKAA